MTTRTRSRAAISLSVVAAALAVGCARDGATRAADRRASVAASSGCGVTVASPTPGETRVPLQEGGPLLFRVNQVGYVVGCPKLAFVMVRNGSGPSAFSVLGAGGRVVLRGVASPAKRWNRHYVVRALDFSGLRSPGVYVLRFAGGTSPPLRIGDAAELYRPLAGAALSFLQSQRDGAGVIPGPMDRRPSHLDDATAPVYAIPRYNAAGVLASRPRPTGGVADVQGGWFDAGDYLKFVATASFTDSVLLFTARQFPAGVPDRAALLAEARYGTSWLEQMWNEQTRVLYFQVGIGDGNGSSVLGDHDIWRLPQADDHSALAVSAPAHLAAHRPVFAANAPGRPISPNLAGGVAAAFGLCAQDFAASDPAYAARCLLDGQTIYDQANLSPRGALTSSVPFSYYPEREWRADMEFAATELYLATAKIGAQVPGLPHARPDYYLTAAATLANDYMEEADGGEESFTLYDVSTLADFDLVHVLETPAAQPLLSDLDTDVPTVMSDRRDQLSLATRLARQSPFDEANPATNQDTVAHALGYVTQSALYDELGGRPTFQALGQAQLDWALGANAWGSSFMVGAGSVFPHCLANQIPNLSGSLTGSGTILRGATVDGPIAPDDVAGLTSIDGSRRCPVAGATDPFPAQDGDGFAYRDDVRASASSEASDDVAALALLAAAAEASSG